MTFRILPRFLILVLILFKGIIPGTDAATPCDGVLTDVFAVSEDLSFQAVVVSNSTELLTQAQVDTLADGFKIVYNQLQAGSCDNETMIVTDVAGSQVVRLRRNLASGLVTRIVSFRIQGKCRACGNKSLIGNDAPARLLQQSDKQIKSNSGSGKVNRGRFMKQYRLWLNKENSSGRFQKYDIRAQLILKESRIEIVGN